MARDPPPQHCCPMARRRCAVARARGLSRFGVGARTGEDRATEPHGEALEGVREHVDLDRLGLVARELLALAQPL
eukprot:3188147-Prymnesium_polylepis.1